MRQALVGRDSEVAALAECLAAAQGGHPQIVMFRGEPGIGKTRLADEVATRAAALGGLCVWGRASDSVGAPPSWPWRQILGAIAGAVELVSMARERGLDRDLGGLAPDLFPNSGPTTDATTNPEDRFRQFEAVSRLLRDVSRLRPLVVILDDLHWADTSTLLLLRHVVRSLGDDRLLLVANTRPAGQQHAELMGRIAREPCATVLDLGGLAPDAVRTQLSDLLGDQVDDDTAAHVQSLTGGNPFFVREVGRAMADARAGRRFNLVTPTARDAISERLGQLSDDCARTLRTAALVGPDFPVAVVAAATDIELIPALDLIGEAADAGIVEATDNPMEFRFVHALVRDAIEANLSAADAYRLHRRIAEAMERLYGPGFGPRLFDVARHWALGATEDDHAVAAGWLARAGEEALRQLAYEEAARLFRQAIDIGRAQLDDGTRYRLLVGTARALQSSGDLAGRMEPGVEAFELAGRLQRPDLAAEAVLVLEANDGRFDPRIRRMCGEALDSLDASSAALRARVMARFVETFAFQRHDDKVRLVSAQALALAEQSGDPPALAAALRARYVVSVDPEGLEEREGLAARMLTLSRERRESLLELWAHLWRVDVALERGDLSGVGRAIEALAECARLVRGPWARYEVARCWAVLAQGQGRLADARRLESEAFAILAPIDHVIRFVSRSALTMNIAYHAGHDPTTMAAVEYEGGPPELHTIVGFVGDIAIAHALVTEGNLDRARDLYRSLGPVAGWDPPSHVVLVGYTLGIGVAVAVGEPGDVAELHHRLSHYRGHHVASGLSAVVYFGPVELWLGVAARHLGRLDDAVADLQVAVRACSANGADGFHAEAQYELAETLARRAGPGDGEEARRLLAGAGSNAAKLGMRPLVARIDVLRGRLGPDREPGAQLLTRREREVAALVSEGLANREIARRLFIAEKTAENHVQHILTKLGLSSRSQIAVWAVTEMSTGSG